MRERRKRVAARSNCRLPNQPGRSLSVATLRPNRPCRPISSTRSPLRNHFILTSAQRSHGNCPRGHNDAPRPKRKEAQLIAHLLSSCPMGMRTPQMDVLCHCKKPLRFQSKETGTSRASLSPSWLLGFRLCACRALVREQPLAGEKSPQVHGGIKARETSLAKGLAERWSVAGPFFVSFARGICYEQTHITVSDPSFL